MTGKDIFEMLIFNLRLNPVKSKLWLIGFLAILLGSLVSCQTSLISIDQISPQQVSKTVYLTGKVIHIAPFVDNAAYQIEDNTGKVWVVTTLSPPKLGQQISIKGKIEYQSLAFAEQELGDLYVVELEQLESQVEQK